MVRMNDLIREQDNNPGGQEPVSFRSLAAVKTSSPAPYSGPDWYRMAEEALGRLASSGQQVNPFQLEGLARVAMMEEFTKIATGFVDTLQQSDHFVVKA